MISFSPQHNNKDSDLSARQNLLKEIQRRVGEGYYDRPEVFDELVRRLSEILIYTK